MKFSLAFLALPFSLACLGAQQTTNATQIPQIVTSGTGEAQITPDRARIDLAVETRGATAALAASENARLSTAVLTRLRTLGLTDAQLGTWGYNVQPEYDYSRADNRPRVIGYVARNTVRADVRQVAQVGPVIDAAVAAGANNIGALDFYSSNLDQARATALAQAVEKARADAQVMAAAAGGRLGTLIELSSSSYAQPPMPYMARMEMAASQATPTPINPGERTITMTVTARWRFEPR
jgi:uncharacterized protein YggE